MARVRFIFLAGILAFSAVKCNGGDPPPGDDELPAPLRPEPSVPVGTIKASFSVSPDGDAQYTVPIPVPPGRAGLQPAVSVVYDSGQEESHLGVGWSLQGFSAIRRCGSTIAQDGYVRQVKFDADDHFCLGDQRLIAVNGQYGAPGTTYHTEQESYARIVSRGLGPDYFEVWTKNGQLRLYGCDPEYPDPYERGNCNALIFARDNIPQAWAIKEVRDRLDNYMVYHYSRWDSLASEDYEFKGTPYYSGPPETVEFAPYMIQYTGKRGKGSQAPQRSIIFDYETEGDWAAAGSYARRGHFAGIRTRLSRKLVGIRTNGPGLNNAHVFKLSYETSSATRRRTLTNIKQCDNQGVCLPPTVFEWETTKLQPAGSWIAPSSLIPADSRIEKLVALDVNGDGRSDLAYIRDDYWRLLISTGDALSPFTTEVNTGIGGVTEIAGHDDHIDTAFPMDYDGDGLDDLVVSSYSSEYLRVYLSTGDNLSVSMNLTLQDNTNNDDKLTWLNHYLKFVDISGDGLKDYLFCEMTGGTNSENWKYRKNNGSGFGPLHLTTVPCMQYFPEWEEKRFLDAIPMDVNADGAMDLLLYWPNSYYYKAALFTEAITGTLIDTNLPSRYNYGSSFHHSAASHYDHFRVIDVNGDGVQDLLKTSNVPLPGPKVLGLWLNTGDGFIGGAIGMDPGVHDAWTTDAVGQLFDTRMLDYDGDGMTDVLAATRDFSSKPYTMEFTLLCATGKLYDLNSLIAGNEAFVEVNLPFTFDYYQNDSDGLIQPNFHILADIDGDTLPDLVAASGDRLKIQRSDAGVVDVITKIRNGRIGVSPSQIDLWKSTWTHKIEYRPTSDPYVYRDTFDSPIPRAPCVYPVKCKRPTKNVVQRHHQDLGDDAKPLVHEYKYKDGRYDLHGRGWLGFGQIERLNLTTYEVTTNRYDNFTFDSSFNAYPRKGRILYSESIVQFVPGRFQLATTEYTYEESDVTSITQGKTYSWYLKEREDKLYESTQLYPFPSDLLTEKLVTYDVNPFGDVEKSEVKDKAGTTTTVESQYSYNTNTWLISLLGHRTTTSTTPVQTRTRIAEYTYHQGTKLLKTHTIEKGTDKELAADYTIDSYGNVVVIFVSDRFGAARTTIIEYEAEGIFPIEETNSLGHSVRRSFDPVFGTLTVHKDPNALVTKWAYDGFGRRVREVRPDGSETSLTLGTELDSMYRSWETVELTRFNTTVERTTFDRQARPKKLTRWLVGGLESVQRLYFGDNGKLARITIPAFAGQSSPGVVVYTYDRLGRALHVQNADGTGRETEYERLTTRTFDTTGVWPNVTRHNERSVLRNHLGQVVHTTDAMNGVTSYYYGAFGSLRWVRDHGGNDTSISKDAYGRVTALTTPSRGLETREYNAFGDLTKTTDANGDDITYTYDDLGRLVTRDDKDNLATWTYDSPIKGIGKLWTSTTNNWGHSVEYAYGTYGKVKEIRRSVSGKSYTVAVDYDGFGRPWKLHYPEIASINERFGLELVYDAYGHNTEVKDLYTQDSYWHVDAVDASSRLIRFGLNNSAIKTRHSFNALNGQLTSITATMPGGVSLQNLEYEYDTFGRLTARNDLKAEDEEGYEYDKLNRLKRATYCWWQAGERPCNPSRTYDYNAVGNITQKSDVGTYQYDPAQPFAVTQAGADQFGYDAVGNQTSRPNATLSYTAAGKLLQLQRGFGKAIDVEYDADDNRVLKQSPTGSVVYIGSMYEEVSPAGTQHTDHKYYVKANGRTVAVVTKRVDPQNLTTTTEYLHRDNLSSIVAVTDESGTVVKQRLAFDPFGQNRQANWGGLPTPVNEIGMRYGFTGHEHDEDLRSLSLINMGGREYDPRLGRFLTADPFVPDPLFSQSLNRYSYVHNSPTNLIDPTGYYPLEIWDDPAKPQTPELPPQVQQRKKKKKQVTQQMGLGERTAAANHGTSGVNQQTATNQGSNPRKPVQAKDPEIPPDLQTGTAGTAPVRMHSFSPAQMARSHFSMGWHRYQKAIDDGGYLFGVFVFNYYNVRYGLRDTFYHYQSLTKKILSVSSAYATGTYTSDTHHQTAALALALIAAAVLRGRGRVPGKGAKVLFKSWHKATFPNRMQSVRYHLAKHGRGRTALKYTRDAMDFFRRNRRLGKKVRLRDGTSGIKIQTKVRLPGGGTRRVGGFWTDKGKLVTFWD